MQRHRDDGLPEPHVGSSESARETASLVFTGKEERRESVGGDPNRRGSRPIARRSLAVLRRTSCSARSFRERHVEVVAGIANSRRETTDDASRRMGIDTVRHALARPAGICEATEGKREWDSPSAMLKPCARVLAFPAVYRLATDTLVSPSPARLSLSTLPRHSPTVRDGLGRKITPRKNSHPRPSRFSTFDRK